MSRRVLFLDGLYQTLYDVTRAYDKAREAIDAIEKND